MLLRNGFLLLVVMTFPLLSKSTVLPSDPLVRYCGRVERSHTDRVLFDWPGIVIEARFEGTSCDAVFEGVNCYDAFVDGILRTTFKTGTKKSTYPIASGLTDRSHRLRIVKRSESPAQPAVFYGLVLDEGKGLAALPPAPERKIEFIGDSYTVGFANEYLSRECPAGKDDSIILAATNAGKSFGAVVAQAFGAQYHLIAISGKGLVRNYNGIDKGRELPAYYEKTLVSSVGDRNAANWDFSTWKAGVVVIGIGINDFQAEPPYADSAKFDAAYLALLKRIRKQYPGVVIICCATKVWPTDALVPRVKTVVAREKKAGNEDVRYFEYITENGALYGHPHIYDHRTIAAGLIPVIAEATSWRRSDMQRGK